MSTYRVGSENYTADPDVAASKWGAEQHYNKYGRAEGRNPFYREY